MSTKNILYVIAGLGLAYLAIYQYQRYKRQKSNETPVTYKESLEILNELEKEETTF